MESSSTTLGAYLRQAPKKYDNVMDSASQADIVQALVSSLCNGKEENLYNYFPSLIEARQKGSSVLIDNGADEYSPAARGQACGHTFKMGEGVYRCRTCGLDETCVLCLNCFHASNHEGHDTTFSVNNGGGGCCDCGDKEAWKVEIDCGYHSAKNLAPSEHSSNESAYPAEILESIRITVAEMLDFIIETMALAPKDMQATRQEVEQIQKDARTSCLAAGDDPSNLSSMKYALVLWNDEHHSFLDVIEQVVATTRKSNIEARKIAETVDSHGRAVIEVSSDIAKLVEYASNLAVIELVVSIRSVRDTFREQICDVCISFLKTLTYAKGEAVTPKHSKAIREIICEELCSEYRPRPVNVQQRNTMDEDEQMHSGPTGADMRTHIPESENNDDFVHVRNDSSQGANWDMDHEMRQAPESLSTSSNQVVKRSEATKNLRIDSLLLLDLKFWKVPRVSLREVYIGTMVLSSEHKKMLGIRFAMNYFEIAKAFLAVDREPELSIILFSVQLFTVPTIAEHLAREHRFISTLFDILRNFFLDGAEDTEGPINCNAIPFTNRRYFHIFHDLRYILTSSLVKSLIPTRPEYRAQMISCLRFFQGLHPNIRHTQDHVEFENTTWVNAFNVTLQLFKCCRQFSDCFSSNPIVLTEAIKETMKSIYEWCSKHEEEMVPVMTETPVPRNEVSDPNTTDTTGMGIPQTIQLAGATQVPTSMPAQPTPPRQTQVHVITMPTTPPTQYSVIKYQVSTQPVSFHHPLHWFFADLLENVKLLDEESLQGTGFRNFRDLIFSYTGRADEPESLKLFRVQEIFDYPLRVCVLMAQIKANIWVRNGAIIRTQAQYYREVSLRENTYDSDIFLLQVAFILLDPEHLLATMLDRFELLSWFSGDRAHSTYDIAQIVFMAEELLTLLIVCVSDRVTAAGFSIAQDIQREIVHGLCLKPIAYSELTKRIPERLTDDSKFDDVLKNLATYRAPDGISDHGLYELRDEYFDEVDPYFIHYSRNNSEEAEEILKNRNTKKTGNKTPVIWPRLTKIERGPFMGLGNMMHTKVMVQILFYTFWNVKAEPRIKSDTIIDQAVYMMQIALVDESNDVSRNGVIDSELGIEGFIRHATFEKFPVKVSPTEELSLTLLHLVIERTEDPAYKSVQPKMLRILEKFYELGSTQAKAMVNEWRTTNGRAEGDIAGSKEAEELAKKKQQAKERNASILAQFAQQQQSFLKTQMYEFDDEFDDDETDDFNQTEDPVDLGAHKVEETLWTYPAGTCIVCQEELTQAKAYGMLGFIQPSHLLRQTPLSDPKFVLEAVVCPSSLDVSATAIRPFGVASNFEKHKTSFEDPSYASQPSPPAAGQVHMHGESSSQTSRPGHRESAAPATGFPISSHRKGLYESSCGHLMHVDCFDNYFKSLGPKQALQHNRSHPENPQRYEFMCPLCKSLGNLLLPITWKGKKQTYPGVIVPQTGLTTKEWLYGECSHVFNQLRHNTRPILMGPAYGQGSGFAAGGNGTGGSIASTSSGYVQQPSGSTSRKRRNSTHQAGNELDSTPPDSSSSWTLPWNAKDKAMRASMNSMNQQQQSMSLNDGHDPVAHDAILGMYARLEKVFGMNHDALLSPEARLQRPPSHIREVDVMWDSLAYTISCVEVTQRGVNAANGTSTLIAGLQQQTLILLRAMADTISSYMAQLTPAHFVLYLNGYASKRLARILIGHPTLGPHLTAQVSSGGKPLLLDDPFFVFVQLSLQGTSTAFDPSHLLNLLLMAEIVKTISAFGTTDVTAMWAAEPRILAFTRSSLAEPATPAEASGLRSLVTFVLSQLGVSQDRIDLFFQSTPLALLLKLVRAYALPFLRKSALLLDARYGVIFPEPQAAMSTSETSEDEYSRLAALLHIPDVGMMACQWMEDNMMKSIIKGWCEDLNRYHYAASASSSTTVVAGSNPSAMHTSIGAVMTGSSSSLPSSPIVIGLNHPGIYELVSMPKGLDALFEQIVKNVCAKCQTVPQDPALCLCCGIIVCSQSFCCLDDNQRGECNIHALDCTGPIGMYLLIKKCVILLLHLENGCFHPAPFLDAHGEADLGLRRGRRQFLNQLRYDDLRRLWLTHGIPIHVARKIDVSFDFGGWQTL